MKKALQTQMRLSKIANISLTETDAMDILEERELVLLLTKELNNEQEGMSIEALEDFKDEHKKDNTRFSKE